MMSLTIITKELVQAEEIALQLIRKRLVIEANLFEGSKCYKLKDNKEVVQEKTYTLICTTKALLFSMIDQILQKKYPGRMPVMYSVPVVNMDWEQSKALIEGTQSV